ncbi:MAG: thiamine phosphate synthase [Pyrinomonadaceae bacterium]|nr:thiamine phosphate synthase [Pyrinomonadaceae bacterium]
MSLQLQQPILYLITSGETTPRTEPASPEFKRILSLVDSAASVGINLIQLREKNLPARVLYELARQAASLTRGSTTRILVNDRADIARAANCDGVHLTTRSLEANIIRQTFGTDFLIGVSTHSIEEALAARSFGADFVVFGPIFDTPQKRAYGPPLGLDKLASAAQELSPFPLVAIGGITRDNAPQTFRAGASGIAAIRLFNEPDNLKEIVREITGQWQK